MLDVAFRRIGPAHLTVVQEGDGADVRISIDLGRGLKWSGIASFPAAMVSEAVDRVSRVHSANDLEDLVREFSDSDTWGSLQEFRNIAGL